MGVGDEPARSHMVTKVPDYIHRQTPPGFHFQTSVLRRFGASLIDDHAVLHIECPKGNRLHVYKDLVYYLLQKVWKKNAKGNEFLESFLPFSHMSPAFNEYRCISV